MTGKRSFAAPWMSLSELLCLVWGWNLERAKATSRSSMQVMLVEHGQV